MQYLLLLYSEEGGWDQLSEEEQEQAVGAYNAYTDGPRRYATSSCAERGPPAALPTVPCGGTLAGGLKGEEARQWGDQKP
jgi:hypothetical protein